MFFQKGFSFIELVIVVAIMGMLAALTIPVYQDYSKRSSYTEILVSTGPIKTAISECVMHKGAVLGCDTAEAVGVTLPVGEANGAINTITITSGNAALVIVPNQMNGILSSDTCTVQPQLNTGSISWYYSGVCVDKHYVSNL